MPQASSHPDRLNKRQVRQLKALVKELGVLGAAKRIGVGREAIARAYGGMELRRGTVMLIVMYLEPTKTEGTP